MKSEDKKYFYTAICMLVLFVLWTVAVSVFDVKPVGPDQSQVGFSTINAFVHNRTGVHMSLYVLTDWLSIIPLGFIIGFGCLGFVQLLKRKNILKVDYDILALGGFYIVVMAVYIIFEVFVINYRPVLINGVLEASYPSSTTMLVMCVITTAVMQFNVRIKSKRLKQLICGSLMVFTVFMVVARFVSGVHWLSDIIGGLLFSAGMVIMYYCISKINLK